MDNRGKPDAIYPGYMVPVSAAEKPTGDLTDELERIAQSWDGCEYDAPGEMIDIGASLRRAFAAIAAYIEHASGQNLASQSQAAQPVIDTPEFMDLLCEFYEQSSCEEFDKTAYDAAREAVLVHLAGQSQATKAQAEPVDQDHVLRTLRSLLDGSQPKDIAGALAVIDNALKAGIAWSYDIAPPSGFISYVKANYTGDVHFHDPEWHAMRLWNAAMKNVGARLTPTAQEVTVPSGSQVQADEAKLYRDLTGDAMALGFDGIPAALEVLRTTGGAQQAAKAETAEQAEVVQANVLPPTRGTGSQHVIDLDGSGYIKEEQRTTGEDGWLLYAANGQLVRGLNNAECGLVTYAWRDGWMEGMQEGAELATGGNTNAESSDLAPTTSTVSAPDEIRNAALEEAAKACENEGVENTGTEGDRCYNLAIKHVSDAIRALRTSTNQADTDTGSAA